MALASIPQISLYNTKLHVLSVLYFHDMCLITCALSCVQSGEVWYEVAGELTQEGLRPVTPDQECLTNILQTHEEKAEETLRIQVSGWDGPKSRYMYSTFIYVFCLLILKP